MLPPLPTVPGTARYVTAFGAVPDDNLPDDDAIAAALAALKPNDWLVFPPGRYIQSKNIVITVPGVTVWGAGATLHATDPLNQTLSLQADGVRVYGFTLTAVTDVRRSAVEQTRISIYRDWTQPGYQSGNVVRGNTITSGSTADTANSAGGAGILVSQAMNFTVAENTVRRTLADGIHVTAGSRNGRILNNTVRETGDDMIATVSYLGTSWQAKLSADASMRAAVEAGDWQVSNVLIQGNNVAGGYWGRGLSAIGSRNITMRGNTVSNVSYGAGIIVAQEGGYTSPGPRNVLIDGNIISGVQNGQPPYLPAGDAFAAFRASVAAGLRSGHGAVEVHAIQNLAADVSNDLLAPAITMQDVRIVGNDISDSATDGVRIGVSTPLPLLQRIGVVGNSMRKLTGTGVRNLLNGGGQLNCIGNTTDGYPSTAVGACTLLTPPVVVGATLDCTAFK